MTDFSKTKFHCSSLGHLMSNGRSKKEEIPDDFVAEGAKKHLAAMYAWEKYKKFQIPSGTGKGWGVNGKICENTSIDLVNTLDGTTYSKNMELIQNDFLLGRPDVIERDSSGVETAVIDVKSSWNMRTFIVKLRDGLLKMYWWQAQGYMWITNLKEATIHYCLVSPPQDLIDAKIELIRSKSTDNDNEDSDMEWFENGFSFNDIPAAERRLKFVVERDDEAIAKIEPRIIACRKYLSELETIHKSLR